MADHFGSSSIGDIADSSRASYERHPVEDMEPELTIGDEISEAAEFLAKIAVWETSGGTLKTFCQRAAVRALLVRPDLMQGVTLERLGDFFAVSRANMDKLAIDFTRTFHYKGVHQKSATTRKRCQQSQIRVRNSLG